MHNEPKGRYNVIVDFYDSGVRHDISSTLEHIFLKPFKQNEEWQKLTQDFNSGSSSGPRTTTTLRSKFKSMKKEYRKYKSNLRQSQYATGGGPADNIDSYPHLDDMDELISLSAEGLFNPNDSDRAVGEKLPTRDLDAESKDSSDMDMELGEVGIQHWLFIMQRN